HEVDDCRGALHVYSDGSIWRSSKPSFNVPVNDDGSILWKDVIFDDSLNLQLRLYKLALSPSFTKLSIFYINGGCFCIGSRTPNYQNYCFKLALELQVVVISLDYRLALENRLSAAIEDSFMALKWLQAQAESERPDTWFTDVTDFGKLFISGDLAGSNIAHNLAVRLGAGLLELAPVQVRGYVLLAPYFGRTVRTKFEAEGPKEAFLNMEHTYKYCDFIFVYDKKNVARYWRLFVQVGDTTDHLIVNPFRPYSPSIDPVALDPILVVVGGSHLLKGRADVYAKRLKTWGKKIEYVEFEGQQHDFFTIDPNSDAAKELMLIINRFIDDYSC
ncbi:LOW QUALITY PROTEIN: Abhydrolase_3 domain-containing protein, partial [Cephalotus follicularis]